jgi:hypothetical protein
VKRTLAFACLLAFNNLALSAQTAKGPFVEHATEKSAIHVLPPQEDNPAGLKTIYTDLGSKTEPYSGGGFPLGPSGATAMAFTPKSDSHVSEVQVAVLYISGDNQVNLSIYDDAAGAPGTLIGGPVTVTNLPKAGTCCLLDIADFAPVAVKAGTQYWVVANTPSTGRGSDFEGGWGTSAKPIIPFAVTHSPKAGWFPGNANELPAGEVLGTVP